jgi:hypothetical protein
MPNCKVGFYTLVFTVRRTHKTFYASPSNIIARDFQWLNGPFLRYTRNKPEQQIEWVQCNVNPRFDICSPNCKN